MVRISGFRGVISSYADKGKYVSIKSSIDKSADDPVGFDVSGIKRDALVPILVALPDNKQNDVDLASYQKKSGLHPEDVYDLPLVNGFSAYIEASRLDDVIAALPPEAKIALNRPIHYPDPHKVLPMSLELQPDGEPYIPRLPGIEKVWSKGYTGKGQTIAVIDSGIYPHPDLQDKIVAWIDLTREASKKPIDPFGHGTHVSGVIAGTGKMSDGKVKGVAPDAKLVGIRISRVAEAIKALQWVIENKDKFNIRVVNMSLGDYATKSYRDDPWAQAVEKAVQAGLIVVVAAGNEGPKPKTISTPGIDPLAITVGAYDNHGTPEVSDDATAEFSSRGPTNDGIHKPDVLAPGVGVFGTLSPGSGMDTPDLPHIGKDYVAISGTSQATPMISGLVALLLQANPELGQQDVVEILKLSAVRNFDDDVDSQGAGLVQADKALNLALHWNHQKEKAA